MSKRQTDETFSIVFSDDTGRRIDRMGEMIGLPGGQASKAKVIGEALRTFESILDRLEMGDIFHVHTAAGEVFEVEFLDPVKVDHVSAPKSGDRPALRLVTSDGTRLDQDT